jgi:hypothetical protein
VRAATASLTGGTLLAWLKLLALDGDLAQAGAQDPALPHPARRGPADPQQPALPAEDPRHPARADAIAAAWARITALPQAP